MTGAPRNSFLSELDQWIARRMARDGTPGLSIVATDREKTLWTTGYGFADIAAHKPVTPETLFEFGSIGKSFTALLLLRMQERGLVDLHAPVADYLPWFSVTSEYAPITIAHLLSHTGGIISGTDFAAEGRFEAWALRETAVSGPPGEHYAYSNLGYKALGFLIEDVLGKSYGEAVTEELLVPLGMAESVVPITDADRQRIAVAYRRQFGDRPGHSRDQLVPETWIGTGTADGGIAASANDMGIYARLLLNRGNGIISEASFADMLAPHARVDQEGWWQTYGYGLATWQGNGRDYYGHTGGMIGYTAQLFIDADAGLAVVAMVNGPGMVKPYAEEAIEVTRAIVEGHDHHLSDIPSLRTIAIASDLAGTYRAGEVELHLIPEGDGLLVESGSAHGHLETRYGGALYADLPGFDRYLLGIERVDGEIVALTHGPHWFAREGITAIPAADAPATWQAFTGEYRCYNPWQPPIRIVQRRDQLLMISAEGDESVLHPTGDARFMVDDPPTAEWVSFDTIVNGKALRLIASGQAMYRFTQ